MSNPPPPQLPVLQQTSERTSPLAKNVSRWFEVSLALLVAFGSSFLYSLYLLRNGPGAATPISYVGYSVGMIQEATTLLLLGYVLSRRGRKFANLGLRWSPPGLGVGLLVLVFPTWRIH
jgi:hypothetical protein